MKTLTVFSPFIGDLAAGPRPFCLAALTLATIAQPGCSDGPLGSLDDLPLETAETIAHSRQERLNTPIEPVGQEEYERLLSAGAGASITAEDLTAIAEGATAAITQRMNEVAALIDPDSADWRAHFATLQQQHPENTEALLASYREELDEARAFTETRDLVTLPNQEMRVVEVGNIAIRQAFPLALYLDGKLGVTPSATLEEDPAYLVNHCDVCIPPLAIHEGYPGHHVGFWHLDNSIAEKAKRRRQRNLFVLEGWALYSEIMLLDLDYYGDDLDAILGAWRSILHRSLRAAIDPKLHLAEITPEAAVERYQRELMMTEDAAITEVRRHLSQPTTKVTYFVGLLQLLDLRMGLAQSDRELSEREIHDGILSLHRPYPEVAQEVFETPLRSFSELGSDLPWSSPSPATTSGSWFERLRLPPLAIETPSG